MTSLAVSLGDPAGVGPELLCRAWLQRESEALPLFFVVGGAKVLAQAAEALGLNVPVSRIAHPQDAAAHFASALPVLGRLDGAYSPGKPDPEGARLALQSLEAATRLAIGEEATGVVTSPVSKALLAEVGFSHPGQTEFLAHACSVAEQDAVMMLAGPQLRTVPVTVHIPLCQVAEQLNVDELVAKSRIAARALQRDFGIAEPRLALAALNPHAGEKGNFGHEEERIITPAIAALRAEGISASGPHPADALFTARARATYDVAICMYHDQALIPLKTLDFDNGVNMTLGLPIVRTSPDHGTAFDIAGSGKAEPGAMIAAIRMAGEAAAARAAS